MLGFFDKGLRGFLALLLAAFIGAGGALAETWDMPTPYPDATFHTVNIHQFAEEEIFASTDMKISSLISKSTASRTFNVALQS